MKVYDVLDLTSRDVVVGQHGVWIPGLQVKVPFQWGGRIQKYRHLEEASYPLDVLWEDVAILRVLAQSDRAPAIGSWVYFKTVLSDHPGGWWADPCGAYGYEMQDAAFGSAGDFTVDWLQTSGYLTGSARAWNDLRKPGNILNGRLVDIHRSGWDRLRWSGPLITAPTTYQEPSEQLQADLLREGQFPFRERAQPYQEYLLGKWWPGEREVRTRAEILGFRPRGDETVLDIGCQLGGFLQFAYSLHPSPAARLIGIDSQPEYIDLARRLARAQGWNICYRLLNAEDDVDTLVGWTMKLAPRGIDALLLLSMLKHLRGGEASLWHIVGAINAETTYIETNAVKAGAEAPLCEEVRARRGSLVGWSRDRNRRACYRVGAERSSRDH